MQTTEIESLIKQGLPGADAVVKSEDNTHFEAVVVAADFEGKATLARHRLVYATLGELMGREIHALSLRTLTPVEAGQAG